MIKQSDMKCNTSYEHDSTPSTQFLSLRAFRIGWDTNLLPPWFVQDLQ